MRLILATGVAAMLVSVAPTSSADDGEPQQVAQQRRPPPAGYPPRAYPAPPRPYPRPHYGPPQAPPRPSGPPSVVYGWDPDVPPPKGYFLDSNPNGAMVGVGVGLLTAGYVTAAVAGAVVFKAEEDEPRDEIDSTTAEDWIPLFVPVGGPFAAIFTADTGPASSGVLIANGVIQLGGLIGIIVGAVDREYKVVRRVGSLQPMLSPHGVGLGGRF